jgi:putative NADPH-quinone reductase
VLGIAGSPRRDGNTDSLLRAVLQGAEEAGAETEFIALRNLKLGPCIECGRCQRTGRCAVADGVQEVHEKLLAADHVVFAAPIFFVGISAQAKQLVDRCQCFWWQKYVLGTPLFSPNRPERRGLFVSCCGSELDWMFDGARRVVKAFFNVLEITYAGEVLYKSIDAKGAVRDHPVALEEARAAGRRLVAGPDASD